MLKFPRPRQLLLNEYPDSTETQPELFNQLITSFVKPQENSRMDNYIMQTIEYLKDEKRKKVLSSKLNNVNLGSKLYFIDITIYPHEKKIKCLVDTGAANSLLHKSIADELQLKSDPANIRLATATGTSDTAITGISHQYFNMSTSKGIEVQFCTNFIISTQLNGLEAILGAEFLLDSNKVQSISANHLAVLTNEQKVLIPITTSMPTISTSTNVTKILQLPEETEIYTSHNIKQSLDNETLPAAEEMFDNHQDLVFSSLDKQFTIHDGDYSDCPVQHKTKLISLLESFHDRFSKSKLDLETTDMYEARLPTMENKVVNQKCRRLPHHKYNFAMKAIKQLEDSGVVQPSDSPWRSNVVLVPKPSDKSELRENTKASQLTGDQHTSKLYRLCLDFRELNDILIFPQNTQFTTIDNFLHTLKNKVCVSLDISSSFFIIPIHPDDRYKTAFWINESSFEFRNLVMGLKSSPYHLNKFIEKAFSQEIYKTIKNQLTIEEQEILPPTFQDFLRSYFDDMFIFADNYDQLFACFKMVLIAARNAKIKFSIEKSSFFTTNLKVLGYSFNTKSVHLSMDKMKASAIINTKKPSSLYELHSRLASFQYQSAFLPYIKHILYPLHFLLRKKEFKWGEIEETSWQLAKQLASLNLRLTIPDPDDDLVLTTDASKIAAAACLFRVKNNKLELVSTASKYFATVDLNKHSYMLEAIALGYAMKVFAPYLLNCTGKIKIFTDAKALIYAKRHSSHSILFNSTLNYLTNFVSLLNVELYHLPGTVNVLADILSRAISENLNCNLTREHPISKQWASHIPPLPPNFQVSHETLYKFLTSPLKPEIQDIYDRTHRKLTEPKSLQEIYTMSQTVSPEERYNNAILLLEQWNSEYAKSKNMPHTTQIHAIKLQMDLEKHSLCLKEIERIMETVYEEIKDTPLYKKLQKNLEEVSKRYMYCVQTPLTENNIQKFNNALHNILTLLGSIDRQRTITQVHQTDIKNFVKSIHSQETASNFNTSTQENPTVKYKIHDSAQFFPKICENSNGLDIPLQEDVHLKPHELKKINLKVKFIFPKHYCALLMNKSSARIKYNVQVQLGLIDVGYSDFVQMVVQNMTENDIILQAGTAVAQLLLLKAKIPKFSPDWQEPEIHRGGFGSTGHTFEKTDQKENSLNYIQFYAENLKTEHPLLSMEDQLKPKFFHIDQIQVNLMGTGEDISQQLAELKQFEKQLLQKEAYKIYPTLPVLQTSILTSTPTTKENFQLPTQNSKLQLPITQETLSALLAADLADNKKLSIESLIYYQNNDENIAKIKREMDGEKKQSKFILKQGILCRQFTEKQIGQNRFVIYLPTILLIPTIIYIHKHFLHASKTQTWKEFASLYFHPKAKTTISQICLSCMTCAMTRNAENKQIPIGRNRSINPIAPRQAVSIDIIYMPTSSRGHTHGLLIADLYSLYLSFYPMKSKSATAVSTALRQYLSSQGIPNTVYSDNDPSFRSEVDTLLASYNIDHVTSYPYSQKNNSVEAQVRKFKNCYRAALMDSPIMTHKEWHMLYPLVIIRINTTISKYGLTREYVHYGQMLESHLPIITETNSFPELTEHLDNLSNSFRGKILKFLHNKQKAKLTYSKGIPKEFSIHELVMRKDYTPSSSLHPTFLGPYRIMELHDQGALLKDPKTGELLSVHFQNIRKLSIEEFTSLLPSHFDADILKSLKLNRYNKSTTPDNIKIPDKIEVEIEETSNDLNTRQLRSGKLIKINKMTLPNNYIANVYSAKWSPKNIQTEKVQSRKKSILKPTITIQPTPYADFDQIFENETWMYHSTFETKNRIPRLKNYKTRYKSSFNSSKPGTLIIQLSYPPDKNKTIKFDKIIVNFYDQE